MNRIHIFDYRTDKDEKHPITRTATRAVILKDDKILLVHLNLTSEYKFPGGGVEESEDLIEALKRETLEEAGLTITEVKKCLGYTDQIYPDKYNPDLTFYMRSIYYLVEIGPKQSELNLGKYETELGFHPSWVTLDEAIQTNSERVRLGSKHRWTERELFMLRYIQDNLETIKKGSN
ncbi:MAG: NUDIX domain-containing protein [Bacilli bacterium]|nr:NUDIX domain-containing protein [Bacilli bacterium]MBN2877707.1 NUDIX domain-containing protein [Bacilli bacterium]